MEKKKEEYVAQESVKLKQLFNLARNRPFETFDQHRITEMREECADKKYFGRIQDSAEADWFESRIVAFQKIDDLIWGKLFDYYLFESDDRLLPRALKFAFQLSTDLCAIEPFLHYTFQKSIINRINMHAINLYWKIPELSEFLLISFAKMKECKNKQYSDEHWNAFQRAVKLINKVQDITFLNELLEIKKLFSEDKLQHYNFWNDDFIQVQHEAFVKKAAELLQKAHDEQDVDKLFSEYYKTNLKVTVDCPSKVTFNQPFTIKLSFKAEDGSGGIPGQGSPGILSGFDGINRRDLHIQIESVDRMIERPNGSDYKISGLPRGKYRFFLKFSGTDKQCPWKDADLGRITRYIICE
ncbi:MAG: hypothetical protein V1928_00975 [Parcubacteria group bacterium]